MRVLGFNNVFALLMHIILLLTNNIMNFSVQQYSFFAMLAVQSLYLNIMLFCFNLFVPAYPVSDFIILFCFIQSTNQHVAHIFTQLA
jgi:hypothetical protein